MDIHILLISDFTLYKHPFKALKIIWSFKLNTKKKKKIQLSTCAKVAKIAKMKYYKFLKSLKFCSVFSLV